jgi:hypothetical protein
MATASTGFVLVGPSTQHQIEIPESQYLALAKSHKVISDSNAIEQVFGFCVEAYAAVEIELLKMAVEQVLYTQADWAEGVSDIHRINARLINAFTHYRALIDQTPSFLSATSGRPTSTAWTQELKERKEKFLGFAAIEALRNVAQHQGLPINRMFRNGQHDLVKQRGRAERIAAVDWGNLVSSRGTLDPAFTRVIDHARASDFIGLFREHFSSLSSLHAKTRRMVRREQIAAETAVSEAVHLYSLEEGGETFGLQALSEGSDPADFVPVFVEHHQFLRRLQRRLKTGVGLSRTEVSSRPPDPKKKTRGSDAS